MARPRVENCRNCGKHVDDVGPLSARKLCEGCGAALVTEAAYAMIEKRGPMFERWRDSMLKQAEETIAALRRE